MDHKPGKASKQQLPPVCPMSVGKKQAGRRPSISCCMHTHPPTLLDCVRWLGGPPVSPTLVPAVQLVPCPRAPETRPACGLQIDSRARVCRHAFALALYNPPFTLAAESLTPVAVSSTTIIIPDLSRHRVCFGFIRQSVSAAVPYVC